MNGIDFGGLLQSGVSLGTDVARSKLGVVSPPAAKAGPDVPATTSNNKWLWIGAAIFGVFVLLGGFYAFKKG